MDFGGGLERIAAAANNEPDVFKAVDTLATVLEKISERADKSYKTHATAYRVVADHIRAATFLIADGATPSNSERGYLVRRLTRRAVRFADVLGYEANQLADLAGSVIRSYDGIYFNGENFVPITNVIATEEITFRLTLARGMKEFAKLTSGEMISGHDAYILFTTHGFPIELTEELAEERGATVDMQAFRKEMEKHRDLSRAGAEQKFKGGLADHSGFVVRLHTAHHLLLKALQMVLGAQVKQRGSNITGERLRIDFSYDKKMTREQIGEVERIVREQIVAELPVVRSTLPREEAEKLGAEMEFGQKYPDTVSVYSIGPTSATEHNPQFGSAFSIEFCGGPHVANTSELKAGIFTILKEEASSAGVRRIKALFTT